LFVFIVKLIRLTSFSLFFYPLQTTTYYYYYGNVSDKNRFNLKVHFPYATETGGHATIPQAPPKRVATPLPWQHVTYRTETFQKEKKRIKKSLCCNRGR
jgi:hypothetical protein